MRAALIILLLSSNSTLWGETEENNFATYHDNHKYLEEIANCTKEAKAYYMAIANGIMSPPLPGIEWTDILAEEIPCVYDEVALGGENQQFLISQGSIPTALLKMDEEWAIEKEIKGCFFDQLLGFGMTPKTAHFNAKGQNGRLQAYVPRAITPLAALREEETTKALANTPYYLAHVAALSGMLKGIGAGHFSNYLFSIENGKVERIYEIDLAKILPDQNKTKSDSPMCRMCILGLPAMDKSFDPALLNLSFHPNIEKKLELLKLKPKEHLALKTRLDLIREFTIAGGGSPRELFFFLFGRKNLFLKAKELGYPNMIIFNEILKYKTLDSLEPFNPSTHFKNKQHRKKIIENLIKFKL